MSLWAMLSAHFSPPQGRHYLFFHNGLWTEPSHCSKKVHLSIYIRYSGSKLMIAEFKVDNILKGKSNFLWDFSNFKKNGNP